MAQVLGNLINNAAKYTDPGGRIEVAVAREGRDVVFRVRDSGMGIPAAALATVFEPFTQLERTLDRAQGGLGIGLTLVRRLVEMQGGSVAAHSAGPGRAASSSSGCRRSSSPRRVDTAAPAADACRPATAPDGVADRARRRRQRATSPRARRSCCASPATTCTSRSTARRRSPRVDTVTPHAVLLDIGLPGMDGYQVAARMRERPELARTLIVAVSGYGQDEHQARSRMAGVDHHLVKPIDLDAVMTLLADAGAANGEPTRRTRGARSTG